MHQVEGDERIVVGFRHFVADSGDVGEGVAEQARRDPARVVHHERLVGHLEVEAMEAEDAAARAVEQERVGEKQRGEVVGGHLACRLGLSDDGPGIALGGREELVHEGVGVHQDEGAAGAVGVEGKLVGAADQHHGACGLDRGVEQGVPVALRVLEELGALDGVGDLSGHRAARPLGVGEDGRLQRGLHERRHVGDQPLAADEPRRAVEVPQVDVHRDDGRVDGSGCCPAIRRCPGR